MDESFTKGFEDGKNNKTDAVEEIGKRIEEADTVRNLLKRLKEANGPWDEKRRAERMERLVFPASGSSEWEPYLAIVKYVCLVKLFNTGAATSEELNKAADEFYDFIKYEGGKEFARRGGNMFARLDEIFLEKRAELAGLMNLELSVNPTIEDETIMMGVPKTKDDADEINSFKDGFGSVHSEGIKSLFTELKNAGKLEPAHALKFGMLHIEAQFIKNTLKHKPSPFSVTCLNPPKGSRRRRID